MIESSATWQVWKLIHTFSADHLYQLLPHVLHTSQRANVRTPLNNIWTWVIINFLVNVSACVGLFEVSFISVISLYGIGSFVLPFITMLIALGFSMRVAQTIARQREVGNFDLFAALPEGELAASLFITRAYRHPLEGEVRGVRWALALTLVSVGVALISLMVGGSSLVLFPAWLLTGGVERFIGYLQSLVAAACLALLVSQRRNPSEAQGWLVGLFFMLQTLFYIAAGVLLNAFAVRLFASSRQGSVDNMMIYTWIVVIQPLLLISVREVINFGLWQAVMRRLDV